MFVDVESRLQLCAALISPADAGTGRLLRSAGFAVSIQLEGQKPSGSGLRSRIAVARPESGNSPGLGAGSGVVYHLYQFRLTTDSL